MSIFLDAVSPIVLILPAFLLLAIIAIAAFGILWLIRYWKKPDK